MAAATEKTTAIFRKVSVEMYADDRFLALSPVQPSGRSLWLHLITGPHTCPVPGLSKIGRAAMAEELGWDVEAFDEAFTEVFRQGLAKANWEARVVWLPRAIKHNLPQSPNVVTSWARHWASIPDCDLKIEAWDAIRSALKAQGNSFLEAFEKACPKPFDKSFGKPSAKASPKAIGNQEQEQEQEKETITSSSVKNSATHEKSVRGDDDAVAIIAEFDRSRTAAFGEAQGRAWVNQTDHVIAQRLVEAGATPALCRPVFDAVNAKLKAKGHKPRDMLSAMEGDVTAALAAKGRPLATNGKSPAGKSILDLPEGDYAHEVLGRVARKRTGAEAIRLRAAFFADPAEGLVAIRAVDREMRGEGSGVSKADIGGAA